MGDEYSIVLKDETWISIQTEAALPLETINSQLLVLQTAFPTVVRNYDQREFEALQRLWYDIFKNVPEQLMKEAIKRFIINDRKGFFPSPGQIVGYIEQIVKEQQAAEKKRRMLEHQAMLREYDRLVKAGENCANCEFCRKEAKSLFCTNERSINYEMRRGFGITNSFRCEYFSWVKVTVAIGGNYERA